MANVIIDRRDSDTERPINPWVTPEVKAALDALNAKRATGWRPAERTDYGTLPGHVDCFGNAIEAREPVTIYDGPPDVQQVAYLGALCDWIAALGNQQDKCIEALMAWLDTFSQPEAKMEAPLAGVKPGMTTPMVSDKPTLHSHPQRRPTRPDPVKLACATSSTATGVAVWRLALGDAGHTFNVDFHDGDPVLAPYLAHINAARGKNWPVDLTVEWAHGADGWPTATTCKENKVVEQTTEKTEETLSDFIPRRPDNSPIDEALPWGDDNHQRGRFFARYKDEVWGPRACPADRAEAIRKAVLVREYGTDTLKGFNGDADALLKKLEKAVELDYPLAMAYFDEKAKDAPNKANEAAGETKAKTEETTSADPLPSNPAPTQTVANETKPAQPEPDKALAVIKPAQVEVIRDTAFTGRALLPTEIEWRTMGEVAITGFKSGLLKDIKNENAAKFIVETGRELGIPPSLALRKIHLIHGQPSMAAELMWAMVLDSGKLEDFEIVEADDHCTVTVQRKGAKKPYTTTFSLDMAKKIVTSEYDSQGNKKSIPMADKYNWKAMPGVMCKWRALSAACRTIFPDVTLGLYSKEEMEDAIDFSVDPDSIKQAVNA